jgi:hypothetical protein
MAFRGSLNLFLGTTAVDDFELKITVSCCIPSEQQAKADILEQSQNIIKYTKINHKVNISSSINV